MRRSQSVVFFSVLNAKDGVFDGIALCFFSLLLLCGAALQRPYSFIFWDMIGLTMVGAV